MEEKNFYDDFYVLIEKIEEFQRCDLNDRNKLYNLALELDAMKTQFIHIWAPKEKE